MNQDSGTKILFGLVFIGIPLLYFGLRIFPYVVFYLIPFLGITFALGFLWKAVVLSEPMSYQRLAFLFPLSAIILLIVVGFPTPEPSTAKTTIEISWLYHAFNSLKASMDGIINWSWLSQFRYVLPFLLPPERYEMVLYDLRDLSWALWAGLFLGAPTVFLFLSSKVEASITAIYEEKLKDEASKLTNYSNAIDRHREFHKEEIGKKDQEIDKLKERLKAVTETPSKTTPPTGSQKPDGDGSGGVFGSDFL